MGNPFFLFRDLELPTRAIAQLHHATNRVGITDTLCRADAGGALGGGKRSAFDVDKYLAEQRSEMFRRNTVIGCRAGRKKTAGADKDMFSRCKKVNRLAM
jgi:hypothetical protein